jgi:hypothetical protein
MQILRNSPLNLVDPLGLWPPGSPPPQPPPSTSCTAGEWVYTESGGGGWVCLLGQGSGSVATSGGGNIANGIQPTGRVEPNLLNKLEIPILRKIAATANETVGIGLNISGGAGNGRGVAGGWSGFLVVSPNGQAAFAFTWASVPLFGPVSGKGFLGGAAILHSAAQTPQGLAGFSVDFGASVANGLGVGSDLSYGSGGFTNVTTFSFGLGGNGHAAVVQHTSIIPICPS